MDSSGGSGDVLRTFVSELAEHMQTQAVDAFCRQAAIGCLFKSLEREQTQSNIDRGLDGDVRDIAQAVSGKVRVAFAIPRDKVEPAIAQIVAELKPAVVKILAERDQAEGAN